MRFMLNVVVTMVALALVGGAVWLNLADQQVAEQRATARSELHRFQQQIALRAALANKSGETQQGETPTFPASVDPAWFNGELPANPLLDDAHPWLEVAHENQRDLTHPPRRFASDLSVAKFWYNPFNGRVRARVPAALSDQEAQELYDFVNGYD